jgi:hypothetical protein
MDRIFTLFFSFAVDALIVSRTHIDREVAQLRRSASPDALLSFRAAASKEAINCSRSAAVRRVSSFSS